MENGTAAIDDDVLYERQGVFYSSWNQLLKLCIIEKLSANMSISILNFVKFKNLLV